MRQSRGKKGNALLLLFRSDSSMSQSMQHESAEICKFSILKSSTRHIDIQIFNNYSTARRELLYEVCRLFGTIHTSISADGSTRLFA